LELPFYCIGTLIVKGSSNTKGVLIQNVYFLAENRHLIPKLWNFESNITKVIIQIVDSSNLKIFESQKSKWPKQGSQYWLRSHMHEGIYDNKEINLCIGTPFVLELPLY
jgi:hypothetical protein